MYMESFWILLGIIFTSIGIIVFSINRFKLHPFLALLIGCLFVGFASGIPALQIIKLISGGFGSILSGIGLIIVLGTVIGVFIEKSGALEVIADTIIRLFGSKRLIEAVGLLGAAVGVPVFCDSGFIILSRLTRQLATKAKGSSASFSLALAAGLYTTHTLVPPTPGPIAVAGNLGVEEHLGMIILVGLLVSISVLMLSMLFSRRLGDSIQVAELERFEEPINKKTLNPVWAFTPIVTPIILIALGSLFRIIEFEGMIVESIRFIGTPFVSLLIGCILAIIQALPRLEPGGQSKLFAEGLKQAGPIILITGAGGAFGNVLKGTTLADQLSVLLGSSEISFPLLMALAFTLAALLKTAQGSSTSALVISSAILSPIVMLVDGLTSFQLSLLVMAFGGGAMTVSHANDSYFWVVTQFSGFSTQQGYRGFTLITLIQGLTTLVVVMLLYLISLFFK